MADILYVGDPHATVAELPDLRALLALTVGIVQQHQPDGVVFLGDQYHHHGILHLEVIDFWMKAIHQLKLLTRVYLMVGNHDKPGNGRSDIHSMMIHAGPDPRVQVIDISRVFEDIPGVVFVPHQDSAETFVDACRVNDEQATVVCHQTFDGGRYENGFYAKDGIDPNLIPQKMVLSGHIHAPQSFGKVTYIGAPRWRTSADANTDRHLWLVRHVEGADPEVLAKFRTGDACRRILHLDLNEFDALQMLDPLHGLDPKKDNITVTLTGGEQWLKHHLPLREAQGFKVRTVKTGTSSAPRVRESEGIATALKKFMAGHKPKHGTTAAVLDKLVAERLAHG